MCDADAGIGDLRGGHARQVVDAVDVHFVIHVMTI